MPIANAAVQVSPLLAVTGALTLAAETLAVTITNLKVGARLALQAQATATVTAPLRVYVEIDGSAQAQASASGGIFLGNPSAIEPDRMTRVRREGRATLVAAEARVQEVAPENRQTTISAT